jgi:hypothetical protein
MYHQFCLHLYGNALWQWPLEWVVQWSSIIVKSKDIWMKSLEKEIWPLGMCTVALYYGVKCVLNLNKWYILKYVVKYIVTTCNSIMYIPQNEIWLMYLNDLSWYEWTLFYLSQQCHHTLNKSHWRPLSIHWWYVTALTTISIPALALAVPCTVKYSSPYSIQLREA